LCLQLFQLGLNLFQSRHYGFLKSVCPHYAMRSLISEAANSALY
jgi:hypothetical protein